MSFRAFPDGNGIEMCALEEDVPCFRGNSRFDPAEYSGNAHSFFFIAYHQVAVRQASFHSVEGDESGLVGKIFYNDFLSRDLVGVESVKRLSYFVLDEIRYVNHIVYRIKAYRP